MDEPDLSSYTKAQLVRIIRQQEEKRKAQAQRNKDLLEEIKRERKLFAQIHDLIIKIDTPNHDFYPQSMMLDWIMHLEDAVRRLFNIQFVRYGMRDFIDNPQASDDQKEIAEIFTEIWNYFDWDDK